jgi:hypothetical protein
VKKRSGPRVETKIFVFVFSRKVREQIFRFSRKKLPKSYENNESFRVNKNFAKNGAGSEKAVRNPNSKRQMKFRTNRSGQCSESNEKNYVKLLDN